MKEKDHPKVKVVEMNVPLQLPEVIEHNGKKYVDIGGLEHLIKQTMCLFSMAKVFKHGVSIGKDFGEILMLTGLVPVGLAKGAVRVAKFDPTQEGDVKLVSLMCESVGVINENESENTAASSSMTAAEMLADLKQKAESCTCPKCQARRASEAMSKHAQPTDLTHN